MDYTIGVDFDNTLVSYDGILYRVAEQEELIFPNTRKTKKDIRDSIRRLPNGELKWQRIQAIVYGSKLNEAKLIDGVHTFFEFCKKNRVKLYIISHKTKFAKLDKTQTNLHVAALTWMRRNKFFKADGLGLSEENVYFESTRSEKIERIRYLRCTHFIDDLEETFLENSFPTNVEKIFYAPHRQHSSLQGVRIAASWEEISDYFFAAEH